MAGKSAGSLNQTKANGNTAAAPSSAKKDLSDSHKESFPVVGIGASAGGLAAFEAFFEGMPPDREMGMAFILVQHLAPDHKSILTELVRRYTRMQVFEVEDGIEIKPDCAYIIPPNCDMALLNGSLQLLEPAAPRGHRLPIDFFFRSMALDQRERAICIVLSGTGSDGTQGLRAVKGEGGMAMVQNPDSTEFDGMPRNAIATGMVDFILQPKDMAAQLAAFTLHTLSDTSRIPLAELPKTENVLKKIFVLLRVQEGHDFSLYKPSTIKRRIERRMAVHQIETLENYLKFLQKNASETTALFKDLLIGVTSFFRDPEAFGVLGKTVIPNLCAAKPAGSVIRIWVPGCSTGEEAYSIAILLQEHMEKTGRGLSAQVFATDIDSNGIATARRGVYPSGITADVAPELLVRFFNKESGSSGDSSCFYRIHKNIRDMMIFSEQDLIRDPPFSRVDLVSCRNLLIYLGGELQKRLMPVFHYSLNPGGFLFLGTSETIGEFTDQFTATDRKMKVYQRKDDSQSIHRTIPGRYIQPMPAKESPVRREAIKSRTVKRPPLRELAENTLLEQMAPAAALVNKDGDILYLHGRTGMFLEPAPGETGVNNILKMAREGLRYELTDALRKAASGNDPVKRPGLRVKTNGDFSTVNLTVQRTKKESPSSLEPSLYLIVLDYSSAALPAKDEKGTSSSQCQSADNDTEACIAELERELRLKEEYLQSTNEELETTNEELKSSNEEMQSINEELQSTNEELETSKEELQSINEELSTVNSELQSKVSDLSRANNDMNNLLAGTGIGTVFVDNDLNILRFTPAATMIINLINTDIGRPVGHIASNLADYSSLVSDVQKVLDSLTPKELEVQTTAGDWFSMRIQPYRTIENVIEGAVITFTDITELKELEGQLQNANELMRLALAVRDAGDAITVQDISGRILAWNNRAAKLYGWSEEEAMKMNIRTLIPEELQEEALLQVHRLSRSKTLEPVFSRRLTKSGKTIQVSIVSTPLFDENGNIYGITTTERPGPSETGSGEKASPKEAL